MERGGTKEAADSPLDAVTMEHGTEEGIGKLRDEHVLRNLQYALGKGDLAAELAAPHGGRPAKRMCKPRTIMTNIKKAPAPRKIVTPPKRMTATARE